MISSLARIWSVGSWFVMGLFVGLGRMIWVGISNARRRRKPGEPPIVSDGGSFNAYRGR